MALTFLGNPAEDDRLQIIARTVLVMEDELLP